MKDRVILRPMQVNDFDGATHLWANTSGVAMREYDDSLEGIKRFLSRNPDTSFVLDLNGEIIGTLLCGNDGRRGYLYHFVVREDFQGQGLGTRLLEAVCSHLQESGIPKVGLVAFQSNILGLQFWKHKGWTLRHDLYYLDRLL